MMKSLELTTDLLRSTKALGNYSVSLFLITSYGEAHQHKTHFHYAAWHGMKHLIRQDDEGFNILELFLVEVF